MTPATLGDHCVIACAEAFRGDGACFASPMAPIPRLGARLAQASFEPDLVLTDGVATILDAEGEPEGWMPFRSVFDVLWSGRRHVMMGASQLDPHGNQNISCIGDHARPKTMLIGVRGAPGNTVCHPTSYWIEAHGPRLFVPKVDLICGVGTDRGAFELRRVITNLGVLDLNGPDRTLRLIAVHPGVSVEAVQRATGFPLALAETIETTRAPTPEEAALLDRLDPDGAVRLTVTA